MKLALRARISALKDALVTSLWFIPALMLAGAAVLAQVAIEADQLLKTYPENRFQWMLTTDEAGARELLSIIASSMLGVAGVMFSVAVVVLSLAAGQLGPRLVRSHMQQRSTQVSLGLLTSTFLYCLLVLMHVQDAVDTTFRAQVSTTLALVLAVSCVGVLIYYIHHVAIFIQADSVIGEVSGQLRRTLARMLPERRDETAALVQGEPAIPASRHAIHANDSGYVEHIEYATLVDIAAASDLRIEVLKRPGHFVIDHSVIALVDRAPDEEVRKEILAAVAIGKRPLPEYDPEFAIRQLVEIAVRALSPGINDPFTASACIDQLTVALGLALQRDFPPTRLHDDSGRLRLIRDLYGFSDLVDASFNQIRQNARGNAAVTIRLLDSLTMLAPLARRPADRDALARHGEMVAANADMPEPNDLNDVKQRHAWLQQALATSAQTHACASAPQ